jgi:Xaa-Pro aminopeptidase
MAPSKKSLQRSAPAIAPAEFNKRRQRVLAQLKGSAGLVLAGEQDPSLHNPFRPHAHFEYLTGITDEPGAMLLLDPGNPMEQRRCILLLKPLNPELEKWDGFRHELGSALRECTGVAAVMRTSMLSRLLLESAKRTRKFSCLMPLAAYNAPVSGDLELFRRQAERVPGLSIDDRTEIISTMRAAKSPAEVACVEHAGAITAHGFTAAFQGVCPGLNEFDVQEMVEHAYRTNGARALAFRTIAGGGFNATVLHYHANDQPLAAGDLMVLDSGASHAGYSADVTRTIPVSGRFNARQRELYNIVLKAQLAAIAAVRAGATLGKIDSAARAVITKAGLGDAFIHGTGHHLGLETHDVSPDAPLREGAIVTIEPGIYLPAERTGIRIEDDVVVTKSGCRVLTAQIPKSVAEVERAMKR